MESPYNAILDGDPIDPCTLAKKVVSLFEGVERTTEISAMAIADSLLNHKYSVKHDAWMQEHSPSTAI